MAGVGNPADMSDFPRLSSGPFTRGTWPPLIRRSVFADCFRCICLMDFPAFTPGLLAGVLKPPQHGLQAAFSLLSTPLVICCHSVYPGGHVLIHSHPPFPCDPTKTAFFPPFFSSPSVQSRSHICQPPSSLLFHFQRS